tara:strand:+ start:2112 stop:2639 length:528 start_codon:yes stop_codon:yes gene_type:complete
MSKRIAITGNTKRIGKAIYEAFPNSVGCGRGDGGDITTIEGRTMILHQAMRCDVFINNAHDGFSQVEMLNMMFTAWKDKEDKHIINIGTDAVPYTDWQVVHRQYPIEKMALHAQAEMLQSQERKCKITTLALGHVDTEFNKEYNGPKLSYNSIVDTIKWVIDQPTEIKFIVVSAK